MAFWNRNQNRTNDPNMTLPNVQPYKPAATRDDRSPLIRAGALLVMVFLSVLILLALFYAGRWLYQTVTSDDEPQSTSQDQIGDDEKKQSNPSDQANPSTDKNSNGSSNTNSDAAIVGDTGSSISGGSSSSQVTQGSTNQSQDLAAAGPEHILMIAGATVIFSASAHYAIQRRRI